MVKPRFRASSFARIMDSYPGIDGRLTDIREYSPFVLVPRNYNTKSTFKPIKVSQVWANGMQRITPYEAIDCLVSTLI